jgi:hypothetical protein
MTEVTSQALCPERFGFQPKAQLGFCLLLLRSAFLMPKEPSLSKGVSISFGRPGLHKLKKRNTNTNRSLQEIERERTKHQYEISGKRSTITT